MNLQETIRKILIEETNPLNSALRRVNFTENDIIYFLKKFSLKFYDVPDNLDLYVKNVCDNTAYELIEPGLLHMSDEDSRSALKNLSQKLKDKYSGFIKDYIDDLVNSDDNETYCFRKHKDKYMSMNTRGFGDCVTGWVNFIHKYGSWFPDLNWNEIKEKISTSPNKYMLIKNPLEGHPYEYYFSVLKVKK